MGGQIAITIGSFDGVHRGHERLVNAAREAVGEAGRVVALVFDPHPLATLRPSKAPERLSTFDQRREWLRAAGASDIVRLEPTRALLDLTAARFLERVAEQWRPAFVVEGYDFRFGRGRGGTVGTLRQEGARLGFETIVVEPVTGVLRSHALVTISSTLIRWLVRRGRVEDAAVLLGRPCEIRSTVARGARRGRELGFPTANLAPGGQMLPAEGVYAGAATDSGGREWPAAISVGRNETFGRAGLTCEAHLIGWAGALDEYGWPIRLRFTRWLREQIAFAGADPLVAQMRRDVERASRSAPRDAALA
jgi:riboflavin kinase/FMN adenylyltransferase